MLKYFLSLLMAISLNASCQTIEEINKARLEKRFEDAFVMARSLAEHGNAQAQFILAVSYLQAQGTEKNESEGFKWMKSSADKGNINALFGTGILYEKGQGVPFDLKTAFSYKEKAAFLGYPSAQYNLGLSYMNGAGVDRNIGSAQYWLERTIQNNDNSPFVIQLKERAKNTLAKLNDESSRGIPTPSQESSSTNSQYNPKISTADVSSNVNQKIIRPGLGINDPRLSCISSIENDSKLQALNGKIATTVFWDISFPMLSNQSVPTVKEQQAIAYWADELRKCISDSSAYRQKNYSRELLSLLDKEDEQLQEAAIDLYNKKSTYGKYNSRVQQIFKESKVALDNFQQNKVDQEEQSRARAAAMRDAQQRQEQQRMTEQRQAEQRRQAEQSRIAAVRQQWQARCELDKRNAYEQYTKSKENTCNGPNKGLAVLCVTGNIAAANDYADAAFKSCMSGAPIQ